MPLNPIGIKSDGSYTELDGVAVANPLTDVASLSAYAGTATSVSMGGRLYSYSSTTQTAVGRYIVAATGKGSGCWVLQTSVCNVLDFGAIGDGLNDDRAAIQAAINFAKSQKTGNGGDKRMTVQLPHGNYRINGTKGLDVTNANGVVIAGASVGRYIATGVNGNCTGPMFDFTGSTSSGVVGLSLFSSAAETTPARVAVQFALGQDANGNESGGLLCIMRDCFVMMDSIPTANGGLGTIPVLNIRAEQFSINDCVLKGDHGMMLTNRKDVTRRIANGKSTTTSYTFESDFYTVRTGIGSMGVVTAHGMQIETNGTYAPGLFLNGVNSLSYQGYITVGNAGNGGQEYAIEVYQPMFTSRFQATIEGYRAIWYQAANSPVHNTTTQFAYANITGAINTPVHFLETGASWFNMCPAVTFGNGGAEMGSRPFVDTPIIASGDNPTSTSIQNSVITCSSWTDPTTLITPHLWKQCANVTANGGQAVDVRGGLVTYLAERRVFLGNDDSTNAGTVTGKVIRFNSADKATTNSGNGGYYAIYCKGVVDIGDYGPAASATFDCLIHIHQTGGGINSTTSTSTILTNISSAPSYATINNITPSISWTANNKIASLLLTVTTGGQRAGEKVSVNCQVSMLSQFFVNRSTLFD